MFGKILKRGFLGLAALTFAFSLGCSSDDEGGGEGFSGGTGPAPKTATQLATPTDFLSMVASSLDLNWKTYNDANFRTDLSNYKAALPQFGDSSFITNSSRLFTNFGFQLCGQAFEQERNIVKKVVFRFINTSVGPQIIANQQTDQQVKAFLTHIAARFWGRAPNAEEMGDLLAMYNEHVRLQIADGSPAAGALRTEEVAEYVCTVLASSAQALLRGGKTL